MPNIAAAFKSEISRVARKEVRAATAGLKKATALYRAEIAALKRRTQELEQALRRLGKQGGRAAPVATDPGEERPARRFSPKGLASSRRRLGLSVHDCGLLLGTSAQSIYNWEDAKTRPRASYLAAIGDLKSLGKKEAKARLEALREST